MLFDKFKSSALKLKSTKTIAMLALFIGMKVVVSSLYIPVGENLRIYFTFFIVAIEAAIFGPTASMLSAAIADIIGVILFPSGPFFIGYTISAICGSLIYSLLLYDTKTTILKLAISKTLVNFIVNVGLGSYWSSILFSKGYYFYLIKSLVKNATVPCDIEMP